jgi:hypothetical protein
MSVSDRDKRILRLAGLGLAIYLALFFGLRAAKNLEARRDAYQRQTLEAQRLKAELQLYADKQELVEKLKQHFNFNPLALSRTSLVAQASSAIQKAAAGGGVQLGPIRESAAKPSAKELASMTMDAIGPVTAIVTLLHRLEALGFPLVIDAVQMNVEANKPNMVKISLTIVLLDFDQWKPEEVRRA